ncbi:hypothetical protein ACRALDRAFT_204699 [Sodiomyces alcalophilus JCM 7366]|uniref:uncharacterized protein n=1 Tax=Sodiomyces alcalophilus JCM 7366 TaxID=591952 RepID=UPI0039B69497
MSLGRHRMLIILHNHHPFDPKFCHVHCIHFEPFLKVTFIPVVEDFDGFAFLQHPAASTLRQSRYGLTPPNENSYMWRKT